MLILVPKFLLKKVFRMKYEMCKMQFTWMYCCSSLLNKKAQSKCNQWTVFAQLKVKETTDNLNWSNLNPLFLHSPLSICLTLYESVKRMRFSAMMTLVMLNKLWKLRSDLVQLQNQNEFTNASSVSCLLRCFTFFHFCAPFLFQRGTIFSACPERVSVSCRLAFFHVGANHSLYGTFIAKYLEFVPGIWID